MVACFLAVVVAGCTGPAARTLPTMPPGPPVEFEWKAVLAARAPLTLSEPVEFGPLSVDTAWRKLNFTVSLVPTAACFTSKAQPPEPLARLWVAPPFQRGLELALPQSTDCSGRVHPGGRGSLPGEPGQWRFPTNVIGHGADLLLNVTAPAPREHD